MKTKFPTYYRPSAAKKQELFNDENSFFVFDTNALLDLYRLGKETTDKVLNLIDKYKSRIIIPYHVAKEYHIDLLGVITSRIASYNNVLNAYNDEQILNMLCDNLKLNELPTIKEKLKILIGDSISKFFKGVEEERDYLKEQFQSWTLQQKISDSLGGNILDPFNEEEIKAIESEGQKRYENKIPPGYEDIKKDTNTFGDLIIWKEILRFAKSKSCSVIFISRDLKEDWILRRNGMDCGPRQELLEEFKNVSDGVFIMCTLNRFLEYANKEQKVLNDDDLKVAISTLSAWGKILNKYPVKSVSIEGATPKDNAKESDENMSTKSLKIILPDDMLASKTRDTIMDN